ncbi:MAG: hypothetical protein B7Y53_01870, partial [Halothiobacillus sp. 28-55-5]
MNRAPTAGLYHPSFEKDNCGFGLIAHMDDQPSHHLVSTAIEALARMTHRGGISADGKSGDGCGILLKKPDAFFRAEAAKLGLSLAAQYAVGVAFVGLDAASAQQVKATLGAALTSQGLSMAGWRAVPVDPSVLGRISAAKRPDVLHVFVNAPDDLSAREFDTKLYIARRITEKALADDPVFYMPSMAAEVISYKGLMMPDDLAGFYLDLQDATLASSQCVFHQRFSTNTFPEWRLAQPFRY